MNWYKQSKEADFDWGKIEKVENKLIRQAQSACKKHSHLLAPFVKGQDSTNGERLGHSNCINCKLWVYYRTGSSILSTAPRVHGPALMLECEPPPHGGVRFDPAYEWSEEKGDFVLKN